MKFPLILGAVLVATSAGCAGAQASTAAAPQPLAQPAGPLAAFAGRRVLVLPTRYLRGSDSLGWSAQLSDPRAYLNDVDSEIAFALSERGVAAQWVFPDALARSVRRNATYAIDPYALSADWLRPPMRRMEQLADPLGSQLRALVALQEGARYVLFPVEVRFVGAGPGGRAVLHLVMIDARLSRVIWAAEIQSEAAPALSPALAASLGSHVADLVAPLPR